MRARREGFAETGPGSGGPRSEELESKTETERKSTYHARQAILTGGVANFFLTALGPSCDAEEETTGRAIGRA